MNILVLGDVVGPAGVKAVKERLPQTIKDKKVDFVIVNGENAADSGRGITKKIFEEFLKAGADVSSAKNVCNCKVSCAFHQYSGVFHSPICLTLMIGVCPKTSPNITADITIFFIKLNIVFSVGFLQ